MDCFLSNSNINTLYKLLNDDVNTYIRKAPNTGPELTPAKYIPLLVNPLDTDGGHKAHNSIVEFDNDIITSLFPNINISEPNTIDTSFLHPPQATAVPCIVASSAAEHQTAAVSVHMEASLQSPMGQITQKLLLLRNQILSKTKDSSELLATADCTYNLLVALLELCNDPYHNVIQSAESISLLVLAYQLLNQIFEYLKLLYEARVAENYTTGVFDDRCARILTHSSYDKATRANHSSEVLAILFGWLLNHKGRAFPTADEKKELCHKTQLTLVQVNDWFVNARRRYLNQKSPVSSRGASALLLNPIYTSSSNSSVTRNDNVNTNSSFFKNNKQNIE